MSTDSTAMPERHYHRCLVCLLPFVLQTAQLVDPHTCGCCDGQAFEYMGQVQIRKQRLVQLTSGCACNESCANARGPHCECNCGGKNHGKGMEAQVTMLVKARPVIQIRATPKTLVRARGRAEDWREGLHAARTALTAWKAVQDEHSIYKRDYTTRYALNSLLADARRSRVHQIRMRYLQRLQDLLQDQQADGREDKQ